MDTTTVRIDISSGTYIAEKEVVDYVSATLSPLQIIFFFLELIDGYTDQVLPFLQRSPYERLIMAASFLTRERVDSYKLVSEDRCIFAIYRDAYAEGRDKGYAECYERAYNYGYEEGSHDARNI